MNASQHSDPIDDLRRGIHGLLEQIDQAQPVSEGEEPPGMGAFPGNITIFMADPPSDVAEDDQLPDAGRTVESTLIDAPAAEEHRGRAEPRPPGEKVRRQRERSTVKGRQPWRAIIAVALTVVLALCFGLLTLVDPILQPEAGITLIPQSAPVSAQLSVTLALAPGKGNEPAQSAAVPGRRLPTLTLSQAMRVPTSGIGHQSAQSAYGFVTFYNALPVAQAIPAGTMLTGSDGIEIVTDQEAAIPAGSGATNGAATVPAHALLAGPSGNIGALDINGPCCRAYVLARNTGAFTGGQNARDYPMVLRQDLDTAAAALKTSLGASVQAALSAQVHASETLLMPVPCTPSVTSSQPAGAEAQRITVTVEESCQGIAYQSIAMQHLVDMAFQQRARQKLGAQYAPMGTASITIASVKSAAPDVLRLEVQGTQSWVYQFGAEEFAHLRAEVAGKTKAEATSLLLEAQGVRQVVFGDGVGERLPTDPDRIQVAVFYRA